MSCLEFNISKGKDIRGCLAGVGSLLLILLLVWKTRQYLLCSCCISDAEQTPSVEALDLLTEPQAACSRSQGMGPGFQTVPE